MKRVVLFVVLFFVCATFALSIDDLGWYPVQEWEWDLCTKWGGDDSIATSSTELVLVNQAPLTLTVQGKKTRTKQDYLYEVAYYAEPLRGSVDVRIVLANNKTGSHHELLPKISVPVGGISDYLVYRSSEVYTHATLVCSGLNHTMEVPLVYVARS